MTVHIFGSPESLQGKIQVKLLQNYCPDALNILFQLTDSCQSVGTRYLIHQDNIFVTILPVSFLVNFLGYQNVHCYLMYLRYGLLNSLMITP